ncbi:DUF5011 domain-containing protein [Bifidobacterium boum]|uniref:DUF5011 domain-containing protein n=1 Tax=Bifidobacterium boum TaxID=78343 RepID=A0A848D738_9BIFI|nr:Ig-like domain-containing protein [Bifidobacterium boum]NMF02403.1 DUF5011 domain-containing protein [Bifidobacterium boum]
MDSDSEKGRAKWFRAVAVVAAAATLFGGVTLPLVANAEDNSDTAQQSTVTEGKDAQSTGSDASTITALVNPDTITATAGQDGITLPPQVTAQYADGSSKQVDVTWTGNGYHDAKDLKNLAAGTYTFEGAVQGTDKKASATLVLAGAPKKTAAAEPEAVAAAAPAPAVTGESSPVAATLVSPKVINVSTPVGVTPQLPTSYEGTLSNGTPVWPSIVWDSVTADQVKKAGTFKVKGTASWSWYGSMSVEESTVEAKVTVAELKSIDPVNVSTWVGVLPELPESVNVHLSNSSKVPVNVHWNAVTADQVKKAGTFKVNGKLQQQDGSDSAVAVTATVTVSKVASVDPVRVKVALGKKVCNDFYYDDCSTSLSSNTTMKFEDGSTKDVSVQWDSDPYLVDTSKEGTVTITGHVKDTDYAVQGIINVLGIRSVWNPVYHTAPGVAPLLTSSENPSLSDGSNDTYYDVQWDPIDPAKYAQPGKFTVNGTLEGTDVKMVATVYVSKIVSINDQTETTHIGKTVSLGYRAYATFADGGGDSVNVTWPQIDAKKFDTAGSFDVEGTVQGTDLKAVCHITVAGLKSNETTDRIRVGSGTDALNAYFELDNGSSEYFDVTWNLDGGYVFDKTGTFDVKGTINFGGTTIDVVDHVTVYDIKSFTLHEDTVTTVTGIVPGNSDLPSATEHGTDGVDETVYPTWDTITEDQVSKAGQFDITGKYTDGDTTKKFTLHIKVVDSQKTRTVSVSTLTGVAPGLPYSVTTVLMNGETRSLETQWETVKPEDYAHPGTFTVKGYIKYSSIPITCKVHVYDAVPGSAQINVETVEGVKPHLPTSMSLKLTDGETYYLGSGSGLVWDDIDAAQYAKAGAFDVPGTIQGASVKPVAHVSVDKVHSYDKSEDITYVRGSSNTPYLSSSVTVLTEDGTTVSLSVTWDQYDHNKLNVLGDIVVNGTLENGMKTTATIHVVDIKSASVSDTIETLVGKEPSSWGNADVVYSNGTKGTESVQWKITKDLYSTAGDKTMTGTVIGTNITVTGKLKVYEDYAAIAPVDVWTAPGVAPQLPSSIGAKYSTSLKDKITSALGGSDEDSYDTWPDVTWDKIDPSQYAAGKDGTTFTVKGTVKDSKKQAQATVHVASITAIDTYQIPTTPGAAPDMPSTVSVRTKDGKTRDVNVEWTAIDPSSYQNAGAVFRVGGKLKIGDTAIDTISTTVRVGSVASVNTKVEQAVVTKTGTAPVLMYAYPVTLDDGTVIPMHVAWDNIPPAKYEKPGTFTVNGTLESGKKVSVKVTVKNTVAKDEVSWVNWYLYHTSVGGKVTLPKQVYVDFAGNNDGGGDDDANYRDVTWDTSKVDYTKPGTYLVTGKVKGTDLPSYLYITVSANQSATFTGFEPVAVSVPARSTVNDLAAMLPDKVVAKYSDNTTQLVEVNWNPSVASQDDLDTVGKTITITGTTGLNANATAKVTVVTSSTAVAKSASVEPITTDEGVKPNLPSKVTVTMSDGSTVQSMVTWDYVGSDKWGDGKGGTTFEVNGQTQVGSLDVTATVTVNKVPKFTVTFDANGGTLAGAATQTVRKNAPAVEPKTPTRDGEYSFVGWSTDKKGTSLYDFAKPVTGDLTLYAQWTKTPHPVKTVAITGTDVTGGKATVTKGESTTVSATITPTNATDKTVSWKSSDTAVASVIDNGDGTATITAKRGGKATITVTTKPLSIVKGDTAKTDTITVMVPASITSITASIETGKNTYTKGDAFDAGTLKVTAKKDDGTSEVLKPSQYTVDLAGKTVLDTVGTKNVTVTLKSDPDISSTVSVSVAQRYWKVSFNANGGSKTDPVTVADDGTPAAKPADPTRDGYTFAGWTSDKAGTKPYAFDAPVTGDLTLYAQWHDVQAPAITGVESATVYRGTTFKPTAGVKATDNHDGDLTKSITVDGSVDANTSGTYTLVYTVSDTAGNKTSVTRTVTVVDKPIPLTGAAIDGAVKGKATVKKGDTLTLTAKADPADATNTRIAWSSSDEKTATVTANADGTATVTAKRGGEATITLTVTQQYTDPISGKQVKAVKSDKVKVSVPATATSAKSPTAVTVVAKHAGTLPKQVAVTFDDGSERDVDVQWNPFDWANTKGGDTVTLTGTVTVDGVNIPVSVNVKVEADSTAPTINVPHNPYGKKDDTTAYVKIGTAFDPLADVKAKDDADGDVTGSITVDGSVDTSKPGTYSVTYTVTDVNGNVSKVKRTVVVTGYRTIHYDGNGNDTNASAEVPEGVAVTVPAAPTRDGYTFTGWTTDKEGLHPYDPSAQTTGDVTLYAQWKANPVNPSKPAAPAQGGPAGARQDGKGMTSSAAAGAPKKATSFGRLAKTGASVLLPLAVACMLAAAGMTLQERKRAHGRHIK